MNTIKEDKHYLKDAYTTWDGYGIQCSCGREWTWNTDSDFSLDDMAKAARDHVASQEQ